MNTIICFDIIFLSLISGICGQNANEIDTNANLTHGIIGKNENGTIPKVIERNIEGEIINRTAFCAEKICIRKCCRKGYFVKMMRIQINSAKCTKNLNETEVINPVLYKKNFTESEKEAKDVLTFIDGERIVGVEGYYVSENTKLYLLETGVLMSQRPNEYDALTVHDIDHFCMDYVQPFVCDKPAGTTCSLRVDGLVKVASNDTDPQTQNPIITIICLYVSSVFLAMTLAVYSFLPELRNLHGKVLMAHVSSMLVAFFTMGTSKLITTMNFYYVNTKLCEVLAIPCYFSILAMFFWMNVMSFDIYWTFRGIASSRGLNRRGENHKFLMYCLYGFGCPLAMTIIFAFLNYLPMDKINPTIITPNIPATGCFLSGIKSFFYLYGPMSVLIVANCVLFVATTWNLCQVRRATRSLRAGDSDIQRSSQNSSVWGEFREDSAYRSSPSRHNSPNAFLCLHEIRYRTLIIIHNAIRFSLYVKVFILMGLSWTLEVVSTFAPQWTVWNFTDPFNLLIGVTMFFIFVCKKKTFKLLTRRYHHLRGNSPSEVRSRASGSRPSCSTSAATSTSLEQRTYHSKIAKLNPKGHDQ